MLAAVHQRIFLKANQPPYRCVRCGRLISLRAKLLKNKLVVHHLDENPKNNDLDNLAPIHFGCHTRLHHTGKTHSEETKRRIGTKHKGKVVSAETREKMRLAHLGQSHKLTDEQKKKISDSRKRLFCQR